MSRPTSVVFYEGPSLLTGDPIVAVASGLVTKSTNDKTGDMIQTWILRADQSPSEAVASGGDDAICGDCKLRGDGRFGRACYVTWWQGPLQVFKTLARLPRVSPVDVGAMVSGRQVRLGAYGDPAAVPVDAWTALIADAAGWTGYTHQWARCDPRYMSFLMASVDNEDEKAAALAMGYRTFRCRTDTSRVLDDEVICPASEEAGHSTTCSACNLCRGNGRQAKSVAIVVHGRRVRWFTEPRLGGENWISTAGERPFVSLTRRRRRASQ